MMTTRSDNGEMLPVLEQLEPRLLLNADMLPLALAAAHSAPVADIDGAYDAELFGSTLEDDIVAAALPETVRTPWVAAVTTNSVYVSVETPDTTTVTVDFGLTAGYGSQATTENSEIAGSNYVQNIKLTGLQPNTEYHYRVTYGATVESDYVFMTAPEPGTSVRWGFAADCRSGPSVHNTIAGLIDGHDPRMMVYGGDLAVHSTYGDWDVDWFAPNQVALNATTPWVNSAGNHEGWNSLTRAFTQSPEGDDAYFSFDYGDAHILILNTEISDGTGSALWNFAAADLAATTQTWKIVVFHRPAYVYGGHSQNSDMLAMTSAIFEPNDVDMVLTGHEHNYQHILVNDVHHMILGSFGSGLYTPYTGTYTVYQEKTYNFGIFDMTPAQLTLTTYRNNNTVIETIVMTAPAPVADDDAYDAIEGSLLAVPAPGVLDNDSGGAGPLTTDLVTDVSEGALTLNENGSFIYTPDLGHSGEDSFTYRAFDGSVYSDPATVTLTVAPSIAVEVILDNTSGSGVTITGSWTTSSWAGSQYGVDYLHDGNTGKGAKSVRYTPTLAAGTYDVYTWYPDSAVYYAPNAPMDIIHAGGTATATVDQTTPGGQWELLGTYAFDAGTAGSVLIRTDGTTTHVVADAVKFTPSTTGPVEVILDNGDAGVVVSGAWTTSSWAGTQYGADYLHDGNTGKGAKSVRYTPTLADGDYDVYVWYPDSAVYYASNAPVDIIYSDGGGGTTTATVAIDQTTPGGQWELLGTYAFDAGTAGSVLVRTDGTSSYVVADAVKFTPSTTEPVEVILDNTSSSGVTVTGSWTTSSWAGTQFGANYLHDGNTGKGAKSVRYTPTLVAGDYDVYIWYPDSVVWYAPNAPVDIIHSDGVGGTTTATVAINQTTPGGQWELLGTFAFDAGTAGSVLVRTDGTTSHVVADAVKFTPSTTGPVEVILDNTSGSGVTVTGSWTTSSWAGSQYGANYLHDANTDKGSKSVRYTPTLAAGTYDVYIWYPDSAVYYETSVPIDITYSDGAGGTTTTMVTVDQTTPGGEWELLGTFAFDAGTAGSVLIRTDGTTSHVVVDAIKFTPV